MDCIENDHLLQQFIYTMNEYRFRTMIMNHHLKHSHSSHKWCGTWTVQLNNNDLVFRDMDPLFKSKLRTNISIHDFIKHYKSKWFKKEGLTLFTVCLVYEGNLVHYVAFIYSPLDKTLISFDPGVSLYHHGQETIVPKVTEAFRANGLILDKNEVLGSCKVYRWKGRRMGVQFDGQKQRERPADAFCQTWTLFFLIRYLYTHRYNFNDFVQSWCSIPPKQRRFFLLSNFIIPTLLYFPKIIHHLKKSSQYKSHAQIMQQIIQPTESCTFSVRKE